MITRLDLEKREEETLSPYACLSKNSKGRLVKEEECDVRTIFQHDRDRIIHSKAFRRLKHKTQVFIVPEGDHYRTRLTHTLEVSQIARTITRALGLNEDLAEAIAFGHDLGHTPFGHAGEAAVNEITRSGFKHNVQSLRVVDHLEKLNLSQEVRNGILNHTGDIEPFTLEGQIVKIADRIAYINHDIDDALRAGIIEKKELPESSTRVLGDTHSRRIDTMVRDMIEASWNKRRIYRSPQVARATDELRVFLFERVYIGSEAKKEEKKAIRVIKEIFNYYFKHPEEIPIYNKRAAEHINISKEQQVIDYIAGMTDRYAINRWKELFMPFPWMDQNN